LTNSWEKMNMSSKALGQTLRVSRDFQAVRSFPTEGLDLSLISMVFSNYRKPKTNCLVDIEERKNMNPTILIVDDEKAILHMFSLAFSKKGYQVRSAESAEEALELLKLEKIHVMFLDLNLPGMNGIELCRAIKKEQPMAVLYALTGYASLFELSDCRDAGFDDYYKKPVSMSLLVDAAEAGFKKIERWRKV